jgi:hypothetical protein
MNSLSASVMGVAKKVFPDWTEPMFKSAKVAAAPAIAIVARIFLA